MLDEKESDEDSATNASEDVTDSDDGEIATDEVYMEQVEDAGDE